MNEGKQKPTTSDHSAVTVALVSTVLTLWLFPAHAQEKSRYMGAEVPLDEAPTGAVINAQAIKDISKIIYAEPTTEKLADGVWCIGGLSIGNTSPADRRAGGEPRRALLPVRRHVQREQQVRAVQDTHTDNQGVVLMRDRTGQSRGTRDLLTGI
jgi:hypothetical protein